MTATTWPELSSWYFSALASLVLVYGLPLVTAGASVMVHWARARSARDASPRVSALGRGRVRVARRRRHRRPRSRGVCRRKRQRDARRRRTDGHRSRELGILDDDVDGGAALRRGRPLLSRTSVGRACTRRAEPRCPVRRRAARRRRASRRHAPRPRREDRRRRGRMDHRRPHQGPRSGGHRWLSRGIGVGHAASEAGDARFRPSRWSRVCSRTQRGHARG